MKTFPDLISSNACIVAVDSAYTNNNGPSDTAIIWDGEQLFYFTNNGYQTSWYSGVMRSATKEELVEASKFIEAATEPTIPYNKCAYNGYGAHTYIGCVVTLSRSRKAPNNTPLKVTKFKERLYNGQYYENEQVAVLVEGQEVWVSSSCIKDVVEGVKQLPFWHCDDQDVNHLICY